MTWVENKKRPLSKADRGRENTRYHLWFSTASRQCPHGVKQHLSLFRATPSFPTALPEDAGSKPPLCKGRWPEGPEGLTIPQSAPLTAPFAQGALALLRQRHFKKATPGGISARFPTALHQPAALWRKMERLLVPITVFWIILTNRWPFVKSFPANNCGTCPNPAGKSGHHRYFP